jgi:hypothetical protein
MWFAANAALRTVSFGARLNEAETICVYDMAAGPVAVATVFRTKDWADRDELAPYEIGLERLGIPLSVGEAFDDTLKAHETILFRTRFVIGDPAVAAMVDLRDSQSEGELVVHQIEERLSQI